MGDINEIIGNLAGYGLDAIRVRDAEIKRLRDENMQLRDKLARQSIALDDAHRIMKDYAELAYQKWLADHPQC